MSGPTFTTTAEAIVAARANLDPAEWDDLMGGAESETTLRRNQLGYDALAFRPRVQAQDALVDPSTSFLGHALRIPVLLGPLGSPQRLTPDGPIALARAAAAFGTVPFVSTASRPDFEEVARDVAGPRILHLAIRQGFDWCADVLARARASGYVAVNLTVGSPRLGRMERQAGGARRAKPPEDPFRSGLTWADVDRIRDLAELPLIVKGISTGEDARIALDHGVDAICVSNHGGRTLDHAQATIDALPEVVDAVSGRVEVLVDGGVMRGSDVIKAVALGARATTIGKLEGIGLAAGGEAGLVSVLEILEDEIVTAMELLGVAGLVELTPEHLRPARPVRFPRDLGGFPTLVESSR